MARHVVSSLFFDDLAVGDEWESPGRTVTEADVVGFAGLSGDFNPIHVDHEAARAARSASRSPTACSAWPSPPGWPATPRWSQTLAFLAILEWKFLQPIAFGDTIRVITRVEALEPRSRGRRGVVTWHRRLVNQRGQDAPGRADPDARRGDGQQCPHDADPSRVNRRGQPIRLRSAASSRPFPRVRGGRSRHGHRRRSRRIQTAGHRVVGRVREFETPADRPSRQLASNAARTWATIAGSVGSRSMLLAPKKPAIPRVVGRPRRRRPARRSGRRGRGRARRRARLRAASAIAWTRSAASSRSIADFAPIIPLVVRPTCGTSDVGPGLGHRAGLVHIVDIRASQQVHRVRHGDHGDFLVVAHARLFQALAERAVDQADGREVLHPGEAGVADLHEEPLHDPERVGPADAREHRRVLDDGQDLAGHLHDDRVGVAVGHQPGQAPPAGHPEPARVVDDDQVDPARLGALGAQARPGAAADDRRARGDLPPERVENLAAQWSWNMVASSTVRVGRARSSSRCPSRGVGERRVVDVLVAVDRAGRGHGRPGPRIRASKSAASASGSWNGCPGASSAETPPRGNHDDHGRRAHGEDLGHPPPERGVLLGRGPHQGDGRVVHVESRPANRSGTVVRGPKLTMSSAPTLTTWGIPAGTAGLEPVRAGREDAADQLVGQLGRRQVEHARDLAVADQALHRLAADARGVEDQHLAAPALPELARARSTQGVVTPNIVAATTGRSASVAASPGAAADHPDQRHARRWSARCGSGGSGRRCRRRGGASAMSLPPTNGRVWPLASVLTITFGTPNGRARIAAVPMTVPAEPPRPRIAVDPARRVQVGHDRRDARGPPRRRPRRGRPRLDGLGRGPGPAEDLVAVDVGLERRADRASRRR